MSLPTPKLDDRNWDSLVEEARRRIAVKCPNWTDFNPSDPGMMLVDLVAWMTETVLYRLNQVPKLNYIKFLDLIGARPSPAQPARTWVFFEASEDITESVKKGTRISTRPQGGTGPITFVTTDDACLTSSKIEKTCSRYHAGKGAVNEREEEHHLTGDTPWEADIFSLQTTDLSRGTAVPHTIYLGDPLLGEFSESMMLGVKVEVENPKVNGLFLEWEAWDGRIWQGIRPAEDATEGFKHDGHVVFKELPTLKKRAKAEILSGLGPTDPAAKLEPPTLFWIRARLVGADTADFSGFKIKSLVIEFGMEEDKYIQVPQRSYFLPTELFPGHKHFIKGMVENLEHVFEKVKDSVLRDQKDKPAPPEGIPVSPQFQPVELSGDFYPFGPHPMEGTAFYLQSSVFEKKEALIQIRFDIKNAIKAQSDLKILWEYPSSDREWKELEVSKDSKEVFARSGPGIVEFRCPTDLAPITVAGQQGSFIRARVEGKNLAQQSAPDIAVLVKSISLRFSEKERPWASCLTENYSDFSEVPADKIFSPFKFEDNKNPAFYICFDKRPALGGPYRIFFDVAPQVINPDAPQEAITPKPPAGGDAAMPREAHFKWEHSGPKQDDWVELKGYKDGTRGFNHEGIFEFPSVENWKEQKAFEHAGHWLRVQCVLGEFIRPVRVRRVLLNAVAVQQSVPYQDRILGSSNETAGQSFSLHTSLLKVSGLEIREGDKPIKQESNKPREKKERQEEWKEWKGVPNFFHSGPEDRHFTVDLSTGTFLFGDGIQGKIPPAGNENIKVQYEVTQGARGNVGLNAITVLDVNPKGVRKVTNYYPAEGGCDEETVDDLMERGPWEIKHRDRAVTEEDFVRLAQKANTLVGPAFCYEENGMAYVVIVPNDLGENPQPNRQLVQDVTAYLDERRLINVQFKVVGPIYEPVDAEIELVLDPLFAGQFSEIQLQVEERLRTFVHPINGLDGSGWDLGRTLHCSELYYRLEDIDGVDHVESLRIMRGGTKQPEDKIKIGSRSYPSFSQIDIKQTFD
jgi:hypothetical protein